MHAQKAESDAKNNIMDIKIIDDIKTTYEASINEFDDIIQGINLGVLLVRCRQIFISESYTKQEL